METLKWSTSELHLSKCSVLHSCKIVVLHQNLLWKPNSAQIQRMEGVNMCVFSAPTLIWQKADSSVRAWIGNICAQKNKPYTHISNLLSWITSVVTKDLMKVLEILLSWFNSRNLS